MEFLIRNFPGKLFIPADISLDSIVFLANLFGDWVGVVVACIVASVISVVWDRKFLRGNDKNIPAGRGV